MLNIAISTVLQVAILAAAPPSAADLLKQYDAIMGPNAFEMVTTMEAHREDGSTRTYKMKVLKTGTEKLRVHFSEPSSARGQEMLRNGDNLWQYMPNLKRAVRVPARDSFMGGDFNNADVLRVNYQADYTATVEPKSSIPNTWQLRLDARKEVAREVAYDHIILWLSQDAKAMPVRAEYFARSGKKLRSADFSDLKDFGGFKRPARITMRNELSPKRFSVMETLELELKDSISARKFVLDDLGH